MNKKKWFAAAVVVAVAAVTLGLVLGLTGSQPQSTQSIQASLPPAGPASEGVQVHGHWTIDVRNPDGSLVNHQEFENALTASGGLGLANLLIGNDTVGPWGIRLKGSPPDYYADSPWYADGGPVEGMIYEPGYVCSHPNCSATLTVTLVPEPTEMVLKGTITANQNGNIGRVETLFFVCNNTLSPSTCGYGNMTHIHAFTGTDLAAPLAVLTDQQILVEVDISFQ